MSWELAARAMKEGIKLRKSDWKLSAYIFFKEESWIDNFGKVYHPNFDDFVWEEYKEPKKMVKWYRPDIIWRKDFDSPSKNSSAPFYKTKKEVVERFKDFKIIKWEEIEAPETWDQCE